MIAERKRNQRQNLSEQRQKTGQEAIRNSSQNKIALYNNQQDHKAQAAQITKQNPGVKPTEENLANLVNQKAPELKPIKDYQGKSLQELEAILDAHNAATGHVEKPKKSNSQVKEAPPQQAENHLPPKRESRYNS